MNAMPKTLTEAIRYYSNEQTCIDAVASLKWPDGKAVCPKCNTVEGERKHYWLDTQKRWKCYACRKQFSVKVGTPFEDSPLSLEVWLISLWMLCNCKNGVSSHEIARATGIAQKNAWFVLQRLRLVLKVEPQRTLGQSGKPVEVDETFIGGRPKNMHMKRRLAIGTASDHKSVVMGMLDRNSREVRAKVVPNAKRETLQNEILKNIVHVGTVYTDGHVGYDHLNKLNYIHETVNHVNEYVRGNVHTQGIENFWGCLKRTLGGTYIAVEPFHLDRYVDEQVFRFNNRRKMDDGARFRKALTQLNGKRLTWAELTGKEAQKAF